MAPIVLDSAAGISDSAKSGYEFFAMLRERYSIVNLAPARSNKTALFLSNTSIDSA
jgi:hypothetical protein